MDPSFYKSLVVVNKSARNGRAMKIWRNIRMDVLRRIPGYFDEIAFSPGDDLQNEIKRYIREKHINCIISAGGDGTVNHILNHLLRIEGLNSDKYYIGGVGLGSSNDFIKPCLTRIGNVPIRLEFSSPKIQDIGVVKFHDRNNELFTRYFIINASIGVAAEANLYFSCSDFFLNMIKKQSIQAAILFAAIRTIITYKNIHASLIYNGTTKKLDLVNLSIIKNNFISGRFHYDQQVFPDDGFLGLNYCHDMTKVELIRTLMGLYDGHFSGKPKTYTARTKELVLTPEKSVAIETDGEIFRGSDIQFSILPKAIHVLGLK